MDRKRMGLFGTGIVTVISVLALKYCSPLLYDPEIVRHETSWTRKRTVERLSPFSLEEIEELQEAETPTAQESGRQFKHPHQKDSINPKKNDYSRDLEQLLRRMKTGLEELRLENYEPPVFTESGETELEGHFTGTKITKKRMSYTPQVEFSLSIDPVHQRVYLNTLRFSDYLSIHIKGDSSSLEPSVVLDLFRTTMPLARHYEEGRRELIDEYISRLGSAKDEEEKDYVREWLDRQGDKLYFSHEREIQRALQRVLPSSCMITEVSEINCFQ